MNSIRVCIGLVAGAVLLPYPNQEPTGELPLPTPGTILDKALAAHGGKKNILKPRKAHIKRMDTISKGKAAMELWLDLPKRWKGVQTTHFRQKKEVSVVLSTGGKVWEWKAGGEVREAAKPEEAAEPTFGLLMKMAELGDGKFTLSALGEIEVGDKKAVGLRAKRNKSEAECYFDKSTGMLLRWDMNWEPEPGMMYHQKSLFDQYKRVDGVMLPYRQRVYLKGGVFKDYEEIACLVLTDVEILKTLPEDTFSLPRK